MNIFLPPHHRKRTYTFALVAVMVLACAGLFFVLHRPSADRTVFGITYSTSYAHQLGLDSHAAFTALLDEVGVKKIRFPLYWSDLEKTPGKIDWSEPDWYVKQAEAKGAELTVVVGAKVPRWPECYIPEWAEKLDPVTQRERVTDFVKAAVTHYRGSPAVVRWQVENEAFFPFGICPRPDVNQYLDEIKAVRALDSRPIQITVSGELEPWFDAAAPADILGISMYRVTWSDFFGYFYYPIGPGFYRARARSVAPLVDAVVISELQAEPWFPSPIDSRPFAEWYEVFDAAAMQKNIDFARRVGLPETYLWGAEWWYFLKMKGESRLWNVAKTTFASPLPRGR